MPSLRELRVKIKSVRQTQKVTKAMKMIAAARLKRAQGSLIASRPYAYKVRELIQHLGERLAAEGAGLPELMRPRADAPDRVLIVFTSDRGLCGSYNVNLLKKVMEYCQGVDSKGGKVHFFVVGKKGRDFLSRHGFPIVQEYLNFMKQPSVAQAELLAREALGFYREHPKIGGVDGLYADFQSILRQAPVLMPLVPTLAAAPDAENPGVKSVTVREAIFDFIYEPERQVILEKLLPRYVSTQVSRMMFEAYTSEQASRMNVMENATRNAGDMIDSLSLLGNKVRQASITREILEVVSGAEALVA